MLIIALPGVRCRHWRVERFKGRSILWLVTLLSLLNTTGKNTAGIAVWFLTRCLLEIIATECEIWKGYCIPCSLDLSEQKNYELMCHLIMSNRSADTSVSYLLKLNWLHLLFLYRSTLNRTRLASRSMGGQHVDEFSHFLSNHIAIRPAFNQYVVWWQMSHVVIFLTLHQASFPAKLQPEQQLFSPSFVSLERKM